MLVREIMTEVATGPGIPTGDVHVLTGRNARHFLMLEVASSGVLEVASSGVLEVASSRALEVASSRVLRSPEKGQQL